MKVNGEKLVERTIRLLKENRVKDIAISTDNPEFNYLNVEILKHKNKFIRFNEINKKKSEYTWLNAYYPTEEPACYLHGDVYYSENAIKTIIEVKVKDTMFFCIRDLQDGRPIGVNPKGREPIAYKVENQKVFRNAINEIFKMIDDGKFANGTEPIAWHLYRYLNGFDLMCNAKGYDANNIFNTKGDYIVIDDYTTDIDSEKDIKIIEDFIKGGENMVRVKVIVPFHLAKFNELRNLKRAVEERNAQGYLYVDDEFDCDEDMAKYLTNEDGHKNGENKVFVEVIGRMPEVKEEKEEIKPKKTTTTRRKRAVAKK